MLAKLIALIIHEVVTEYRKLDSETIVAVQGDLSCVAAQVERAPQWDHDTDAPVTGGAGFRFPRSELRAHNLGDRPGDRPH